MDLCCCPYHTEIKHLFRGIADYRKKKHGPGSGCTCTCSACRPTAGATQCELSPLGDDVFSWLKNDYLCPRKARTMAVLPGGDEIHASFADFACNAGQCESCGKDPLRCTQETQSNSTVVPVMAYEEVDGVWRMDHRKWTIRKVWNRFLACLRGCDVGVAGDADSASAVRTARRPYQAGDGFA